jgi:hypothetical protein
MPTTFTSAQAPEIDTPKHPLHALTTYELAYYRRRLENALAFLDKQDPVPPIRADLQAALDKVIGEQDDRAGITTDA